MTNEKNIEEKLIEKLVDLKYEYRSDIQDKDALYKNFREKFEALNKVRLSDTEFVRLCDEIVSADVFTASETLREINTFQREDGTPLHYKLVNIDDWCKNKFEIINQLRINTDNSHHRYDVIVLINGVPVVQIELKSLDVIPQQAMQQIVKYKNDPGNGYTNTLLCFIQIFVVSNRTNTYYFANNHKDHFSFDADERFLPVYYFADKDNKKINNLYEFADGFFAKCTLGELISRYMVLLATEKRLLIMRPYQIYAVEAIVESIHENRGNGYIWHTTGSGKTLTSFKASTLLRSNPDIEKCLFVVDRKDLDRQTRDEFNRFQKGCVEENTNTEALVRRMLSEDYADKVIVTTIQKLGLALDENGKRNQTKKKKGKKTFKERLEVLSDKRVVFIFDECHRSQFGENHKAIKAFFPKAQMFGFTGTPIFDDNATYKQVDGRECSFRTTESIFENKLHAYTIADAIGDKNVLRFHIDYFGKDSGDKREPRKGEIPPPEAVIEEILKKHDVATGNRRFNAFLATSSINSAIQYYDLFKEIQDKRQKEDDNFKRLNIACVFSPPAYGNKDVKQLQEDLPQEKADNEKEPHKKKEALKGIIDDYNKKYGSNHKIDEFDQYYKDVQKRIKDQKYPNRDFPSKSKIDVVIVVDMLLTGFDSQYLSTLYVDKNLKYHGLIQAFSRTNRILNDTKPYGKILDFRYQEADVDKAIALFSGEDIENPKEIWLVEDASVLVKNLEDEFGGLKRFMQAHSLDCTPEDVCNLKGDKAKIGFINRFREIQHLKTQLEQYTDLSEKDDNKIKKMLPDDRLRAFHGAYLDIANDFKARQNKGNDDISQDGRQLDLGLALFSSALIDYDYIMELIAKYTQSEPSKEKMNREQLIELIRSSANFMDDREEIATYVYSLKIGDNLNKTGVLEGYEKFKDEFFAKQLAGIAKEHGLKSESLQKFVDVTMEYMIFDAERLSDLLAPLELGWKARSQKELALMKTLKPLLEKKAQGQDISGLAAYE